MVRSILASATVMGMAFFAFGLFQATAQNLDTELETSKALESFLSPEEMEMEFGPASRLDNDDVSPWADYDDNVSKAMSARFDRTHDLSGLEVSPIDRINEMMPDHLVPFYDLILYVSKAEEGPLAQQIFIFERDENSELELTDRWMVSTGREQRERYFTTTPPGFFMLDPRRFVSRAYSAQWNGSSMPNAMFFNYSYRTRMSGYAIHGIVPRYNRYLGQRASGGCVRLSFDHSVELFERIEGHYLGNVPVFAFDQVGGTTFRDGTVEYRENGSIRTEWGYRVLLIVDTFAG